MSNHWKTLHQQFCKQSMYDESVVQSIVSDGYDLTTKDECGRTLLHYVSKIPSAKYLIEHKPSIVNIQDEHGHTPLFYMLCKNYCDDPSMLSNHYECDDDSYIDEDVILYMLDHGADPLIENTRKFNCIHTFCVTNTMPECIKDAIIAKCSVHLSEVKDEDGHNPLYTAALRPCYDSSEIVRYLIKSGLNRNTIEDDISPLECFIDEWYDYIMSTTFISDKVDIIKFKESGLNSYWISDTIKVFDQDYYNTFDTNDSLCKKITNYIDNFYSDVNHKNSTKINILLVKHLKYDILNIIKKHNASYPSTAVV